MWGGRAGQSQGYQRDQGGGAGRTVKTGHGINGVVAFFGFTRTTQSPLLKSFT